MNEVKTWCDGGSRGNGSPEAIAGIGVVLLYRDNIKTYHEGFLQKTNNQMEIIAVIKSLSMLVRHDLKVEVYSDSAYVVNCMNDKWHVGWKKNGWKNSKKKPVENRQLWEELLEQVEKFDDIEFIKVKGHADDVYNNMADELANKAMDSITLKGEQ